MSAFVRLDKAQAHKKVHLFNALYRIVMFKKILNGFLDHPVLTSIFVSDFGILMFKIPPFPFSFIMLGGLIVLCMYFGQKLALFNS